MSLLCDHVLHPTELRMGDILNARETGAFMYLMCAEATQGTVQRMDALSGVGCSPLIGHDLKVKNILAKKSESGSSVNSAPVYSYRWIFQYSLSNILPLFLYDQDFLMIQLVKFFLL